MAMRAHDAPNAGHAPSAWLVPILTLAAFVNMLGSIALGPFLPLVAEEFGASVALVGQVSASMVLLAGLLGLVAGPLADHFGYRRTLVVGMLAVAVSGLGSALAAGLALLLVATLVGAIGRAVVVPTAQAVVAASSADETNRRRGISWIGTGVNGSPLFGIPVLTAVAAFADWRAAFFVVGALALAMIVPLWWGLAAHGPRSDAPPRLASLLAAYAPVWRHRPTLALVMQVFTGSIGTWATFTYLGAYLAQQHGFTAQEVGGGYLATGIGTMLGAKLVGTRLGVHLRPLLLATRVAGGLLLGAALILPLHAVAAIVLLSLGALAHTANSAATAALLTTESPADCATTLTFNNSAFNLGVAAGGAVGGAALAVAGYLAIGLVSLGTLLAAAVLVWQSRPHGAPPIPASVGPQG